MTEPLGLPMAGAWKRVRISEIRASRREVICWGDLDGHGQSIVYITSPSAAVRSYSPPGHPSRQISHACSPFSFLRSAISLDVTPS